MKIKSLLALSVGLYFLTAIALLVKLIDFNTPPSEAIFTGKDSVQLVETEPSSTLANLTVGED